MKRRFNFTDSRFIFTDLCFNFAKQRISFWHS